jgi:hypothetical protein
MRALGLTAILLATIVFPGAGQACGSEHVLRDAAGRRTGTVETGFGGTKVLRDAAGRRTGTIEPGFGGSYVIRDAAGRRTGTVEPR